MKTIWSGTALLLLAALAPLAARAEAPEPDASRRYVQGWLGAVDTEEAWTLDDPETQDALNGELDWLPYGGGAGQRLWGDGVQYGFEGGGLVAWKSDRVAFFGQNGTLRVQIDSRLFILDLFMGGVLAIQPANWLRLYVAAGPALAWAHLDGDAGEQPDLPANVAYINLSDSDDDLSLVAYGRAGIDFQFPGGLMVGAGARYADHKFDFNERGKVELNELQWFLIFGKQI